MTEYRIFWERGYETVSCTLKEAISMAEWMDLQRGSVLGVQVYDNTATKMWDSREA